MRVLLINPPNAVRVAWNFPITIFQPLGIAYIAAMLERHGYIVKILDALAEGWRNERIKDGILKVGLDDQDIKDALNDFRPDVVGISALFSSQALQAFNVAKLVKEYDKRIIVLMGGSHPTSQPEHTLANDNIDYIICGEGELAILKFLERVKDKKDISSVPGLAYRNSGNIRKNPAEYIKDLNNLPFPARHLLPMQKYFDAAKKVKASRSISTYGKRWATIFTSRGCPFKCIFCTISQTMGKNWRSRSPENVFSEIELLVKKYKIQHLDIEDDNLTLNKERAKAIFDLIIKSGLCFEWSTPNAIRADTVDEELIIKMKQSGCNRTIVAPESGVQRIVDEVIKKKIDLNKVEQVVRWCKKHKLLVESFFVIGFPGETKDDIRNTIEYAKKLKQIGSDDCAFYIATPFYGTELYHIAESKNYLAPTYDRNNLNTLSGEPAIQTKDFTIEELKTLWQEALRINPPISLGRIKLALRIFVADPFRFFKYAYQQIKRLLS